MCKGPEARKGDLSNAERKEHKNRVARFGEFDEKFLESTEELDKLRNDGSLMFQLVSIVEIDRMKLVQTRAILNYIASKYNLYGKDTKERALIDMYIEGMADLNEMILLLPICQPEEKDVKLALIKERMKNCYFPTFEKVSEVIQRFGTLHFEDNNRGTQISWVVFMMVLALGFTLRLHYHALQALKTRISNLPTVKKFLQPGSQRRPPIDVKALEEARKTFKV
nr:glutathione S-transferase A5 [Pongo abelii]